MLKYTASGSRHLWPCQGCLPDMMEEWAAASVILLLFFIDKHIYFSQFPTDFAALNSIYELSDIFPAIFWQEYSEEISRHLSPDK